MKDNKSIQILCDDCLEPLVICTSNGGIKVRRCYDCRVGDQDKHKEILLAVRSSHKGELEGLEQEIHRLKKELVAIGGVTKAYDLNFAIPLNMSVPQGVQRETI